MNRLANSGRGFVCLNDSLHESLQDHPKVVILYVATVIFVMVFLKVVTRPHLCVILATLATANPRDQSKP